MHQRLTSPKQSNLMAHIISFRQATLADKAFLLRLRQLTMEVYLLQAGIETSEAYHKSRIDEFFDDSSIIEYNRQPVGLIKLGLVGKNIHIRQFQVMPKFQGKGIGARVLSVTQKKALTRGMGVTLNVLLNNPARALYVRNGFEVIGQNALEYQMKWQKK